VDRVTRLWILAGLTAPFVISAVVAAVVVIGCGLYDHRARRR
jgi:hypothetical protein